MKKLLGKHGKYYFIYNTEALDLPVICCHIDPKTERLYHYPYLVRIARAVNYDLDCLYVAKKGRAYALDDIDGLDKNLIKWLLHYWKIHRLL